MVKKFKLEFLGFTCTVVQEETVEAGIEALDLDIEGSFEAMFYHDAKDLYLFFTHNVTPGLIAHEINHAVDYMFLYIEHTRNPNNNELESYFVEYFTDKVYKALKIKLK